MQKRYIVLIVFLVFAVLIFFNNNTSPVKAVSSVIQRIFSAPKEFFYGVKVGNPAQDNQISKENEALQKKLIDYEKLRRDNDAFRSQFETESTKQFKLLPATVIGFVGRFSSPKSLIINQGSNSHVESGMAVIVRDQLVGEIGKVSADYSEIILSSNSDFSTVGVTSEGNIPGVVNGQNDFILFDHVASESKITVGETILSKGDVGKNGIGIPPGLIIGKISSVSHAASLPFQNAKAESKVVPARLIKVFIILGI